MIPRYFEISVPVIPATSGIFRSHTWDIRDTPVFWYVPYQLDQVFSNAIPTIPTRTTVWHTPGIYRGNPGKYPTRCTTHGAAVGPNSTYGVPSTTPVQFTRLSGSL